MTDDERRSILSQVAAGDLTPEAAAELLRGDGAIGGEPGDGAGTVSRIDDEPAAGGHEREHVETRIRVGAGFDPPRPPMAPRPPRPPKPPRPPRPPRPARAPRPPHDDTWSGERASRIRVIAAVGAVKVIGDPDVAEVDVEGPHHIRREGDTLVVELDHEPTEDVGEETGETTTVSGDRNTAFAFVVGLPGGVRRRVGFGHKASRPLVVRVNRDLPLEVSAQAGKATVRDVHGPLHLQVSAGSMDVEGVHGGVHCAVQAGKLALRGRITDDSTVACDAGSAVLHLEEGSDCSVRGTATMGSLEIVGVPRDEETNRIQMGDGSHELQVTVNVGKVRIVGPGAS